MSFRLLNAVALACLVLVARPVISQDTPLTRLVPIEYETGFVGNLVSRFWRIAKPADYHSAGLKVSCPTGSAGSGIFVQNDKNIVVALTNHHVIEGNERGIVSLVAMNDQRTNGRVVWWSQQLDLAIIINEESTSHYGVPIYGGEVPVGAEITMLSYGGPGRMLASEDFRPCLGRFLGRRYDSPITIDCLTISGDSGSGMVYDGALVGINWGHFDHPVAQVAGWSAGRPASSKVDPETLVRVLTQVCQPYGCRPIIRQPGQPSYQQPPAQAQPTPQPQPQPIAQCEPGPQGEPGPPGPPGKDGVDGKDAEVTPEQLAAIAAAITAQLKSDPSLRGPQGEAGTPGKDAIISPEQIKQALADYFANDPLTVTFVIRDPVTGEVEGIDVARVIPESKLTDELQPLVRDALQIVLPVER